MLYHYHVCYADICFCVQEDVVSLLYWQMLWPMYARLLMADVFACSMYFWRFMIWGWCYCLPLISLMLLPMCSMVCVLARRQIYCLLSQVWDIFYVRLMLLPLIDVADVIAYVHYAWCYCHVVDVMPLGWLYCSCSSGMLFRTPSHMWGRWYLPVFLSRDGLFTLM